MCHQFWKLKMCFWKDMYISSGTKSLVCLNYGEVVTHLETFIFKKKYMTSKLNGAIKVFLCAFLWTVRGHLLKDTQPVKWNVQTVTVECILEYCLFNLNLADLIMCSISIKWVVLAIWDLECWLRWSSRAFWVIAKVNDCRSKTVRDSF